MSDAYTLVQDRTPCPQIETVDAHGRRLHHVRRCAEITIDTARMLMKTITSPMAAQAVHAIGESGIQAEVARYREECRALVRRPRSMPLLSGPRVRLVIGKRP